MGWEKRGKRFLHFSTCSFLFFLFLQKLQVAVEKPIASHESEEMMLETTTIVENGLTNVESSSQKVVDELKVSCKENMIEDQEINNFLTAMEETTSGDDL
jgi:transcriptional regulator NrdR family protein